jgi:hypothetical protein
LWPWLKGHSLVVPGSDFRLIGRGFLIPNLGLQNINRDCFRWGGRYLAA